MSAQVLSLTDLNTTINHEPRVSHHKLAEALGVEHRVMLRLIERNIEELQRYGEVSVTVTETTRKGGRPGKTYWPNEPQAILVTIRSDAPEAPSFRQKLIEVFTAWRRQLMPAAPVQGKLPLRHKPIDAKVIHDACDEILTLIGHVKLLTQQSYMSKATTKVHDFLLNTAKETIHTIAKEVVFHA